jgi:hypothetical protein
VRSRARNSRYSVIAIRRRAERDADVNYLAPRQMMALDLSPASLFGTPRRTTALETKVCPQSSWRCASSVKVADPTAPLRPVWPEEERAALEDHQQGVSGYHWACSTDSPVGRLTRDQVLTAEGGRTAESRKSFIWDHAKVRCGRGSVPNGARALALILVRMRG